MKNKMDVVQAREELRSWSVRWTGCAIQTGYILGKKEKHGWPCGTCFCDLLEKIGLKPQREEYQEHNKPIDRGNEIWRGILQIRDAKLE